MEPLSNQDLTDLFADIQRTHFPGRLKKVKAEFYPYRTLRHTVEWTPISIRVKISNQLKNAPQHILQNLALILLAKVFKLRLDSQIKNIYRSYIKQLPAKESSIRAKTLLSYESQGEVYNLKEIYNQLNQSYFDNRVKMPRIGWSKKRSYSRLGFYDPRRDLLVISRIFDSSKVPQIIIYYLMYHEMLHIVFPTKEHNGRRNVHSKEFRSRERQYPEFKYIQQWLKKNIRRL